ncbi:MAG: hypothetical protein WBG11_09405 [Methylocella sp.]
MKTAIRKAAAEAAEGTVFLEDDWFDVLEAGVRTRMTLPRNGGHL